MLSFQETTLPIPAASDSLILNFNNTQIGYSNLSQTDKTFYYWVNFSRKYPKKFYDSLVVPIVNVYSQLKNENLSSLKSTLYGIKEIPLLKLNLNAYKMALSHSEDITEHNSAPSHNSTNGNTFIDRFKSEGLKNCGAENISYGENQPAFQLVLLYLDLNIPDLGHRKNLTNSLFVETGIASSIFRNGNIFLVEDFACAQN